VRSRVVHANFVAALTLARAIALRHGDLLCQPDRSRRPVAVLTAGRLQHAGRAIAPRHRVESHVTVELMSRR
jgi:hypothetical protein